MKRRRTLYVNGHYYQCIEVLYSNRVQEHSTKAVCVACYVTLPKNYHIVTANYIEFNSFTKLLSQKIIYSFLLIPVKNDYEAKFILADLRKDRILIFKH